MFVKRATGSYTPVSHKQGLYVRVCISLVYVLIAQLTNELTHLGRDKMAAMSQTIFSDTFSSMKSFVFSLKYH